MDTTQLAYWIQGMLEFTNVSELSEADLRIKLQGIKDHTALVFKKVTPQVPVVPKSLNDFEKEISDKIKKAQDDKLRKEGNRITPWYSPSIPTIDPSTWKTSPLAPSPYNPWVSPPYTSPYYMQSDFPFEAGKTVLMC